MRKQYKLKHISTAEHLEEIFQALKNGHFISSTEEPTNSILLVGYWEGKLSYVRYYPSNQHIDVTKITIDHRFTITEFCHIFRFEEEVWYDNIPKTGVLCWCWNEFENNKIPGIVKRKDKGYFINTSLDAYLNAEPMSLVEIIEYFKL